jgi:hypothetical protein
VCQITRWKSEDIAELEVKGKPSLIETELAPGKVPKRNDKAELLVPAVAMCPRARSKVYNKTPERIARRGSIEGEMLHEDGEFIILFE